MRTNNNNTIPPAAKNNKLILMASLASLMMMVEVSSFVVPATRRTTRPSTLPGTRSSSYSSFSRSFASIIADSSASGDNNNNNQSNNDPQTAAISSYTTSSSTPSSSSSSSTAASLWHRNRRKQMLSNPAYGKQIAELEKTSNSQSIGLALLAIANIGLTTLAILCGHVRNWKLTLALSVFPGSIWSLWQLQILHDNLHGCLLDKQKQSFTLPLVGRSISKKRLQSLLLFWGSMPSLFGYYLYLQYGHLTHHQAVGNPKAGNLRTLFESASANFEDGDVLFVAHRMKLLGEIGPRFLLPRGKEIVMSISKFGFSKWKIARGGNAIWNMICFATSFVYERIMLCINDIVVAVSGRNYFFPNKPAQFHHECANYCRMALLARTLIWWLGGKSWHTLAFLLGAETLWSIPPHPCCAMFVTNHGSRPNNDDNNGVIESSPPNACIPSSSTYAGKWYSLLTLGTNYHCEHHDFPTIPFHQLYKLRNEIAPEYYRAGGGEDKSKDKLWPIMKRAFKDPDYYACMNDMESIK